MSVKAGQPQICAAVAGSSPVAQSSGFFAAFGSFVLMSHPYPRHESGSWVPHPARSEGAVRRARRATCVRRFCVVTRSCVGQGEHERSHQSWVLEAVPEELTQLAHPVAHGLGVHVQLGGDRVTASLVQEPGK